MQLRNGASYQNYGYIYDLIIRNGEIAAVVVRSDVAYGAPRLQAFPFQGYEAGWHPRLDVYELPYTHDEIAGLELFDYEKVEAD